MAAPDHSAYPTAAEVQSFLEACGITVSAGLLTQLDNFVEQAVDTFEDEAGRVILAGSSETRYFDPPVEKGTQVLYIPDMVTVTTVSFTPMNGTATTLTVNDDYFLMPYDAAVRYEPFTMMKFAPRWSGPLTSGLFRSIAITGRYGYWTSIPNDVYMAVMNLAAANGLLMQGANASTGVVRKKIEDFEVEYGSNSYSGQVKAWTNLAEQTIKRYRRILFV